MSSLADHARLLIAYNTWANSAVLDAASALSEEQLAKAAGASKGSIAGNLRHIVTSQAVWLARWNGDQPPAYDLLSRDGLRAAFDDSHRRLSGYVAKFGDDGWDRVLHYRDSGGNEQQEPMGALITHVVNHGTLHRGEAGMLLGALGHSPGDLDYVYWFRNHRND